MPKAGSSTIVKWLLKGERFIEGSLIVAQRRKIMPKFLFTFVRDPLARFISGFSTLAHRNCWNVSSEKLFEEFMRSALDFVPVPERVSPCMRDRVTAEGEMLHVVPMTAWLLQARQTQWPLDFVGRMETMETDWKRLRVLRPDIPHFKEEERHLNIDEGKVGNAFRQWLFSSEQHYLLERVCRYLLTDYTCFDYPIPKECRMIESDPLYMYLTSL